MGKLVISASAWRYKDREDEAWSYADGDVGVPAGADIIEPLYVATPLDTELVSKPYDRLALGAALKAFFSERGEPIGNEGPPIYSNGSTNQILAACLAYHASASKETSE